MLFVGERRQSRRLPGAIRSERQRAIKVERTARAVFICSLRALRLALVRQPGSVRRRAISDARS